MKPPSRPKRSESFAAGVGRALRRAAKTARKTARMHGTPIYVVEDGKIIAKRPREVASGSNSTRSTTCRWKGMSALSTEALRHRNAEFSVVTTWGRITVRPSNNSAACTKLDSLSKFDLD
jgi:hypothetical protein